MIKSFTLFLLGSFLFIHFDSLSQNEVEGTPNNDNGLKVGYGSKGLGFSTTDNRFKANLGFRLQFRASNFDEDLRTSEGYFNYNHPSLIIRRARIKLGGHAFQPWLKFGMQYDFETNNLIDGYLALEKYKAFNITIGRYKAFYNREREISSSKQLLVERSIVNRMFTVDRQEGFSFWGNVGGPSPANFNYWLSVFTGNGIHAELNDDNKLMYVGRIQWNLLGGETELGEADSDVDVSDQPKASIGFGASTDVGKYTRFSSSGGGVLDMFVAGEPGQYKINQWVEDFIFKYKGFSILQEYHKKRIEDRLNDIDTDMNGYFAQAGLFPESVVKGLPKQLQVAVRYAQLDPDNDVVDNEREELTVGMNWYFNGFRNRVSADYSHLTLHEASRDFGADRFRIQWDVSF